VSRGGAETGRPRNGYGAENGGNSDEECDECDVELVHVADARQRRVRRGTGAGQASAKTQ
jgi:hypothetical protein